MPQTSEKRFPFPMPFGWFCVALSPDIAAGKSQGIYFFSQELVLFRGQNGVAHVMDSYCPHLGANLGVGINEESGGGAEVRDNTLVCPFHGWRFDGDGECVEVPYAKNMPPRVKDKKCLKAWPTVEKNGVIYAWYHPESVAPLWDIAVFEQPDADDWLLMDAVRWDIRSHSQEIAENAADTAHFPTVHKVASLAEAEYMNYEGLEYNAEISTSVNTPRGEVVSQFGFYSLGPGQSVFHYRGLCETFQLSCITPIDDERVAVIFMFYQPKAEVEEKAGLAKALIENVCQQIDEDMPIWEHKRYNSTPMLCDGDGPIAKFRKWYKQFYA